VTEYMPQLDPPHVVLPGHGTGRWPGQAPSASTVSGYGAGTHLDFGRGLSEDHYQVLQGEEVPPASAFVTRLWALVTLDGEPVAFISPDEVQNLNSDRLVAAFLDDLDAAYVADMGEPTRFFRQRLARPHIPQGRVVILSRDFAGTAGLRARLSEFDSIECELRRSGVELPGDPGYRSQQVRGPDGNVASRSQGDRPAHDAGDVAER
jgi:hypothetical protein